VNDEDRKEIDVGSLKADIPAPRARWLFLS
jgi:hypothetical protein